MKTIWMGILTLTTALGITQMQEAPEAVVQSNIHSSDRMLIVLSAPSVHNTYYKEDFENIVAFQKKYAQTVLGNDNIVILVDADTLPYYQDELPEDLLLVANVDDIWMRDFSTVLPEAMVQFTYDPSYFESRSDAERIQESFVDATDTFNLEYDWEDLVLDGGNIVDNGKDKLVTTTRFLEENELTKREAKEILKEVTGVKEVAIIDYDDEVMGHADGMVMWTDAQTLLVNQYDEPFRSRVMRELESAFSGVTIVEVAATFTYTQWRDFNSACGVNLNSVVTYNHIYVPTFNQSVADRAALRVIQNNTDKKVHTISAEHVCHMGGSVRCLSWQITGANAKKLIEAARQ